MSTPGSDRLAAPHLHTFERGGGEGEEGRGSKGGGKERKWGFSSLDESDGYTSVMTQVQVSP